MTSAGRSQVKNRPRLIRLIKNRPRLIKNRPRLISPFDFDAELLKPEKDASIEEPITINVNDYENYIIFENAAFIKNGNIMVPAREFIQNFDGEVNWKPPKSLLICTADKKISMSIGSTYCLVNDQNKEMKVAPIIKDNIAYIPVRFIAEELGYKVSFDKDSLEVCLNNK